MTSLDKRLRDLERREGIADTEPWLFIIRTKGADDPTDEEVEQEVKRRGGRVYVLVCDGEAGGFV